MTDYLAEKFPTAARSLGKLPLADLPTPVGEYGLTLADRSCRVWVKHDDRSSSVYGGNKLRKLEYLLYRARSKRAECVATFGAAASNHMLATTLHAASACSSEIGSTRTCSGAGQFSPTISSINARCPPRRASS